MSLATQQPAFDQPGLVGASLATPSDYIELLKPRVMSLVVFTALCGMMAAPGHLNAITGLISLFAIAVGAGASGALNMVYDADIDAIMTRTRKRPIPDGRVASAEALAFGVVLSIFSVMVLGLASNWVAGALLAGTIFFYAVIYTMWLKRTTPQNIVIGGAAGAFPPMIGYAVATGSVTWASVVLFAIIFIWTPPHFWALALIKSDEYARAGIPMMPNVKGPDRTRTEILIYTLILAPLGCVPWVMGLGGTAYGLVAAVAGTAMLWFAVQVYRVREGEAADKAARHLFGFSILYLLLPFAILLAEHSFGLRF
ncbi:heme o synthase [Lichenifustis flavocetrariae]|uniref:Protoheme IX farnesyltransferase n=1 Tax=Lichenifustis flavocetrariae TaxID=2949735 RepID=A0AA41Z0G0_9HYPH|nr:heme o synthase [Lichenifustis flavocetrariae]MCW6510676.1 heme o synthase [Lichenifustis flavocetrariae]